MLHEMSLICGVLLLCVASRVGVDVMSSMSAVAVAAALSRY